MILKSVVNQLEWSTIMHFRKNQRIIVGEGWQDAGRKGTHLVTLEHEGRTWHIVELDGEFEPQVIILGGIEPLPKKRSPRLRQASIARI